MAKGSKEQKRSTDVIGNAVHVAKIVTEKIKKTDYTQPGKFNSDHTEIEKLVETVTIKERSGVAKKAVAARWV